MLYDLLCTPELLADLQRHGRRTMSHGGLDTIGRVLASMDEREALGLERQEPDFVHSMWTVPAEALDAHRPRPGELPDGTMPSYATEDGLVALSVMARVDTKAVEATPIVAANCPDDSDVNVHDTPADTIQEGDIIRVPNLNPVDPHDLKSHRVRIVEVNTLNDAASEAEITELVGEYIDDDIDAPTDAYTEHFAPAATVTIEECAHCDRGDYGRRGFCHVCELGSTLEAAARDDYYADLHEATY